MRSTPSSSKARAAFLSAIAEGSISFPFQTKQEAKNFARTLYTYRQRLAFEHSLLLETFSFVQIRIKRSMQGWDVVLVFLADVEEEKEQSGDMAQRPVLSAIPKTEKRD